MNTFWLKIAALVVVIVGLIIVGKKILSVSKSQPKAKQKTFYDVTQQDDTRLRTEPDNAPQTEQTTEIDQAQPQFKELSPAEKTQAEELFEMALAQRKMGRLPGMTYKLMVDYCRQIIEKFPDTAYAFKARRMLADIPQQQRKLYNITDDEINPEN